MQTTISIGVKLSFDELKTYYEEKKIFWNEENVLSNIDEENLSKIFTDIPEEIFIDSYDNCLQVIFGFDILQNVHEDNHYGIFEFDNLQVEPVIIEKLKLFLKNNNIKNKISFFGKYYEC